MRISAKPVCELVTEHSNVSVVGYLLSSRTERTVILEIKNPKRPVAREFHPDNPEIAGM
jgi:hypothetical protein